jgi:16S rRNA (guanine966-N2)-methyltransferase
MRVIAGEAKGFRLKGPAGPFTRPMADKIKGALFSMLASLGVEPDRVLDLYAGTGSIGIEALSRGASHAEFVEQNRAAAEVVRANLAHTKFADRAAVHLTPVASFVLAAERTARSGGPFDFVVLDPPYADPEIVPTLRRVGLSPLVQSGAVVAIGHSPRVALPERTGRLTRMRERCHGDSCFSIYEVVDEVVDDATPGNAGAGVANGDAAGHLSGQLRPDHLRPHRRGAPGGRAVRRTGGGGLRGE